MALRSFMLELSDAELTSLRILAAQNGVSMKKFIELLVLDVLEKQKEKEGN
jgi:hypothetical protein